MKWFKENYAWCCFFLLLVLALIFPFQDGDVFFYLSMGRWFFEHGSFPDKDPFLYSFQNWHIQHEWLSYLIFYFFYWAGSWSGLLLMKIALWVAAFFALVKATKNWKVQETWVFLIFILAGVACCHRFVERASLFSDVAVAVLTGFFLTRETPSRKIFWALPLLFLFWVNFHPAFVLGLALFGVYLICQARKASRWMWTSFALSGLACLINPLFWEGAIYPITTAFKSEWSLYKKYNFEWMPTFQEPFVSTWEVRFLMALLALTAVLLLIALIKNPKQNLFALGAFCIFVYLAQSASRFMTTSALGFSFIAVSCLRDFPFQLSQRWNEFGKIVAAVLFLGLSIWVSLEGYSPASGPRHLGIGPDPASFPVGAVEFIKEKNLQGHFFNQYDWGSYLAWELERENFLYLHGHVDDPTLLANQYHGMNKPGLFFDQTVQKFNIRYFLLDKAKILVQPPPPILSHLQSWKVLYQDDTSVIWERP